MSETPFALVKKHTLNFFHYPRANKAHLHKLQTLNHLQFQLELWYQQIYQNYHLKYHLFTFRQSYNTSDISSFNLKLRSVIIEERSIWSNLVFSQDINLSTKFSMWIYLSWLRQNLLNIFLKATKNNLKW